MSVEIIQGDCREQRTMQDRVRLYQERFPRWPAPQAVGDSLYGVFAIGNNYSRKKGYPGEYPRTYLDRIRALFPETPLLHLFSGSIEPDSEHGIYCVDADATTPADYHIRAADIGSYWTKEFAVVLADPPYDKALSPEYAVERPDKIKVISAISEVIRPGGYLVWLDTRMPIWSKSDGWEWAGVIAVFGGTNRVLRGAFILRKRLAVPQTAELFK